MGLVAAHAEDRTGHLAAEAIQDGDERAFAELAERYRRQLHVHCYRMLGSFDEAEDLVQETLLRAWRSRRAFEGRSKFKTWLYRIATNTCLNALRGAPRRILPQDVAPAVVAGFDPGDARDEPPWAPELPWLQPYPDALLDEAQREAGPEAGLVSRETIELAYMAALQHLPPRQRAILVLRDVLGWSSNEVATMLESTTTTVNSALQRARTTLRSRLPSDREDWKPDQPITDEERTALQQFMDAWERADATALTSLLREDARWAMPPAPLWFDGRDAIAQLLRIYPLSASGEFRMLAVGANRLPAAAGYLRHPGDDVFRLNGVAVLRITNGKIADVTLFNATLCGHFQLPPNL